MPLDGVPPFVLVKAYGGSPPPFDQPRLVALLKPKAVVGCEGGGEGGEEGGEGSEGSGGGGGGGEVGGEGGGMPTTAISTGSHCSGQARTKERDSGLLGRPTASE